MSTQISYSLYTINFPKYWLVRDEPSDWLYSPEIANAPHKNMLFHVQAGDYITTLASILRFFEETIKDSKTTPEMRSLQLVSIRKVISDLLYLNKYYTIAPKDEKKTN